MRSVLRSGLRRSTPLLLLLLLSSLPLAAQAQLPALDHQEAYRMQLSTDRSGVYVPFLGNALVNLTLKDISAVRTGFTEPTFSQVYLETAVVTDRPQGWLAALEATQITIRPGEERTVRLNIQAGATVADPEVIVQVNAVYLSPSGERLPSNLTILAIAQPSQFINLQMNGAPPPWSPDELRNVELEVRNDNYYPDMVTFSVQAPSGWVVSPPSTVRLDPGETRTVAFEIKAPQDPWFLINPSSEVILVTAESASSPAARYTLGIPAPISGYFLPGWVTPHIFLLFLGLFMAVRVVGARRKERRLEKGRPRRDAISPEQAAQIAALKKSDPERAQAMEERLHAIHKKRVKTWKQTYGKRRELEKQMAKREKTRHDALLVQQRREEKAKRAAERAAAAKQKARDKQRRKQLKKLRRKKAKAERRTEKARRTEERRVRKQMNKEAKAKEKQLAKLQKKRARADKHGARKQKVPRKELKRREKRMKQLEKKKAKLAKAQAKAEKRRAKEARKTAKADKPGLLDRLKRNKGDE